MRRLASSIPSTLPDDEGIIRNLFDENGHAPANIFAATVCIIEILTGPGAGKWTTELVESSPPTPDGTKWTLRQFTEHGKIDGSNGQPLAWHTAGLYGRYD